MHIGWVTDWIDRTRRPARALLSALPNHCAVCHSPTQGVTQRLCHACIARFASTQSRCRRCALPLPSLQSICGRCLREPPPWSVAVTLSDYAFPWDRLLSALKFEDALDLAPTMAALLALRVDRSSIDLLLPIPLSPTRLQRRGYNQAEQIAASLARRIGRPLKTRGLLRQRETPPQMGLTRAQRLANLHGAFTVEPSVLDSLRGQRIALVDDVMTTGATLAEATRTLRAAGAVEVQAWVISRTPD